jgi:sensor histidine kinase YesM
LTQKLSISLYRKCQLIGWSGASLYWTFLGFSGGKYNLFIGILQFLSDVAVYILITHLYRNFAIRHNWQQLKLNSLLKRVVPAAGVGLMPIWLLAYHLYHYSQREINITKENALLAIMAEDAQLNSLSAQLNPHFLFKSLK